MCCPAYASHNWQRSQLAVVATSCGPSLEEWPTTFIAEDQQWHFVRALLSTSSAGDGVCAKRETPAATIFFNHNDHCARPHGTTIGSQGRFGQSKDDGFCLRRLPPSSSPCGSGCGSACGRCLAVQEDGIAVSVDTTFWTLTGR